MNAFINALKQQAGTIQANIKNKPVKAKIEPVTADLQGYYNDSAEIKNIERVLNRNRLDIYFDKCPNHEQREALKKHSFRYNPDSKAWYNKDCKESCDFIIGYFGIDLDYPTPEKPLEVLPPVNPVESLLNGLQQASNQGLGVLVSKPETMPITEIQPIKQEIEKPCYIVYKKQISELLQALNCEFADLPLIAVDCLYKKTFN